MIPFSDNARRLPPVRAAKSGVARREITSELAFNAAFAGASGASAQYGRKIIIAASAFSAAKIASPAVVDLVSLSRQDDRRRFRDRRIPCRFRHYPNAGGFANCAE